jgi:hypothetical protein
VPTSKDNLIIFAKPYREVEMKKLYLIVFALFAANGYAQQALGSYSSIHTQSGRTFEAGRLEVRMDMNFWTKATEWVGAGNKADFKSANYWLVASNFALTYGLFEHFDFTIAPKIYQDTHSANEYNLPGDVLVNLKAGSFDFANRSIYTAVSAEFRVPTGEVANYPFAEYTSGAFEYGFRGAISWYKDLYLPERDLNAHLHVGWWNHNEASHEFEFGNEVVRIATKNSSELQYAMNFTYPTTKFDFSLDVSGKYYIEQPDTFIYSRDNNLYITPTIKYKAFDWLNLVLGIDVLAGDVKSSVKGVPDKASPDYGFSEYVPWRVRMGLNMKLIPFTAMGRSASQIEKDEFDKRVDFFQKIVEERERAEDVQEELEQLKEEREATERELEELKQILEEED